MNWTKEKPDADRERLVIAAYYTGLYWKYELLEYARCENDYGGFDILIFKNDMEVDIEEINADRYFYITTL